MISIDRPWIILYPLSIFHFAFVLRDFSIRRMVMDDLHQFCCQNKKCPKYGIRGAGNIHVKDTYGPYHTRLLRCRICKQRFSERKGTLFFDSRLPPDTVVSILEHVVEGNGVRKTGRLVKVDPYTVSRYTKLAGEHAEQLHAELVAFSPKDRGGSVRRKVGLRVQEGKKLRRKQSG
jgi:transposase-like protein